MAKLHKENNETERKRAACAFKQDTRVARHAAKGGGVYWPEGHQRQAQPPASSRGAVSGAEVWPVYVTFGLMKRARSKDRADRDKKLK
jgi:hypothetical protein